MERKTIGQNLSNLRKEKGYTQQQVADALGISSKTVSKWECDDGYPEIIILPEIADLYGVTVDEIVNPEDANDADEKITEDVASLPEFNHKQYKLFSVISLVLGAIAVALSFINKFDEERVYSTGNILGILFIVVSVILYRINFNNRKSAEGNATINPNISFLTSAELFFAMSIICIDIIQFISTSKTKHLTYPYGYAEFFNNGYVTHYFNSRYYYSIIALVIIFVISLIVFYILNRKNANAELKALQKKSIITAIVSTLAVCILAGSVPVLRGIVDEDAYKSKFSFANYDYVYSWEVETPEEQGPTDYKRFKELVKNGESIIWLDGIHLQNSASHAEHLRGKYIIDAHEYKFDVIKTDRGYCVENFEIDYYQGNDYSENIAEQVLGKSIYVRLDEFIPYCKNINFVDEECAITYDCKNILELQPNSYYICFVAICLLTAAINYIIYDKKKKKLNGIN